MAQRLVRIDEASALTTFTPSALYRQRLENRAPGNLGFKLSHGALVWDLDELQEWIAARRDAERAKFAARREAVA